MMGILATILNFMLRPGALHFLGFTAASVVFDATARAVGYRNVLDRRLVSSVILLAFSVLATLVAGFIIGSLFINPMFLSNMFGGVALKARGRAISTAFDVAEVTRNRFMKDVTVEKIEIGTEELKSIEGQTRNVSTITIVLKK